MGRSFRRFTYLNLQATLRVFGVFLLQSLYSSPLHHYRSSVYRRTHYKTNTRRFRGIGFK